jgi:hypothetical protein
MPTTPNYSFRLDKRIIERIDRDLKRRDPPISRSQWMKEAIAQKLDHQLKKRDRK